MVDLLKNNTYESNKYNHYKLFCIVYFILRRVKRRIKRVRELGMFSILTAVFSLTSV